MNESEFIAAKQFAMEDLEDEREGKGNAEGIDVSNCDSTSTSTTKVSMTDNVEPDSDSDDDVPLALLVQAKQETAASLPPGSKSPIVDPQDASSLEPVSVAAGRYPLEKRLLHVHSWSNTAPQDGKDTLDCHFSFLKKARQKFVRHCGDIETPADIVKALSTVASTTAGTTIALGDTLTDKNLAMKGKVVRQLGSRTVHHYEYPKPTAAVPLPPLVVRQHNGLVGAGRQEEIPLQGRSARMPKFLATSKWTSTKPRVIVSSYSTRQVKKDSDKVARIKAKKKVAAKPVRNSKTKFKTTEWKLAIAHAVVRWSQKQRLMLTGNMSQ